MNNVGFVVALPDELKTLTRARLTKGGWIRLDDRSLVALAGTGPERAARAAHQLVDGGAHHLISWGCAAALEAGLRSGDVVLADRMVEADGQCQAVDEDWGERLFQRLSPALSVSRGRLVESTELVAEAAHKRRLAESTCGAALDMESAAVFRVARSRGVPFAAVRAIADPAAMDLPKAVVCALEDGDVVLSRLFRHVLLNPTEIPGLLRLGSQFRAAQSSLRRAAALIHDTAPTAADPSDSHGLKYSA